MIDRRSILVDSRLSDYAPFALENDQNQPFDPQRRTRQSVKRDWGKQNNGKTNEHFLLSGVVVGSIIGLLLVLLVVAIVFIGVRLSKYVPLLSSPPRRTIFLLRLLQTSPSERSAIFANRRRSSRTSE